MDMEKSYIKSLRKQFEYYKFLGDKTINQVKDSDLFHTFFPEGNSIAIIVNHMAGNMKSRWTDFLTTDGEKEWRNRDREFDDVIQSREELLKQWEEGWNCLFLAINSVNEDNFSTTIYIRNQAHTLPEAFNRQMMHYAYHVGQIVLIGKIRLAENWESLSISKGQSQTFNQNKMAKGKHGGHFTDDIK